MSGSTGSGGVVGERAWWPTEAVVEGDRGCEREEAYLDAGAEPVQSAGAVAFEGEQAVQAEAPEVAAVACAVAVVGGVGELAAAGRLEAARALDRGRVDQHEVVVEARAFAREHAGQPLDRLAQPLPALEVAGTVRQQREQVRELLARRLQEPGVRADPHDRLRDAEPHDLRVGQDPPSVLGPRGAEIV